MTVTNGIPFTDSSFSCSRSVPVNSYPFFTFANEFSKDLTHSIHTFLRIIHANVFWFIGTKKIVQIWLFLCTTRFSNGHSVMNKGYCETVVCLIRTSPYRNRLNKRYLPIVTYFMKFLFDPVWQRVLCTCCTILDLIMIWQWALSAYCEHLSCTTTVI